MSHAADFEKHRREAAAMKRGDVRVSKRRIADHINQLLSVVLAARAHYHSTERRAGLDTVPYLVSPSQLGRLESLTQAALDAERRRNEVLKGQAGQVREALQVYRALRRMCAFGRHVPGDASYAERYEAVVDEHKWSDMSRRGDLAKALYELGVFAANNRAVLEKVPGGVEAIGPAEAAMHQLRAYTEGNGLAELRDRFMTLAMLEYERVRDAARFLYGRGEDPHALRALRLPPRRAPRRAVTEVEEAVSEGTTEVAEQPQPALPWPEAGDTL